MSDDTEINRDSIDHLYMQVADRIAARIAAGTYIAKMPSERALAEEFGVSYITLRHSMAILRGRGLIVSIHGRGTFVASWFARSADQGRRQLAAGLAHRMEAAQPGNT